ncbi:hypothetical protein CP532_4959 [Ophiocordyceps camponoti-leonardi (nom. inval.)]|nr:hypothetical protein CP532_4959 [Ophiocordyceps camponoti-leonardi (nom. inval.)]
MAPLLNALTFTLTLLLTLLLLHPATAQREIVLPNPHPNPSATQEAGSSPTSCKRTLPLIMPINLGPVRTVWTTTTTTTRFIECSACPQVTVSWLFLGVPPVARFTTTTTASTASTTSVLACSSYPAAAAETPASPSASHYGTPGSRPHPEAAAAAVTPAPDSEHRPDSYE